MTNLFYLCKYFSYFKHIMWVVDWIQYLLKNLIFIVLVKYMKYVIIKRCQRSCFYGGQSKWKSCDNILLKFLNIHALIFTLSCFIKSVFHEILLSISSVYNNKSTKYKLNISKKISLFVGLLLWFQDWFYRNGEGKVAIAFVLKVEFLFLFMFVTSEFLLG